MPWSQADRGAWASEAAQVPFYLIGPGDELEITVRGEPELSRVATVRPDGRLTLPLVEDLPAAGLTPEALARAIEEHLAEYLRDPLVTVDVTSPQGVTGQRIRILGEASSPRSIPYRAGITLVDAITEAGGLDLYADGNSAKIIRQQIGGQGDGGPGGREPYEIPLRLDDLVRGGDDSANLALAPGDVIVIPEGFFSGTVRGSQSANASITYTDNVDLDPDGQEDSALLTRLGGVVTLTADMARFRGAFASDLGLVYNSHESGVSLDGSISAATTTEILRDHVFFDLNAGISQEVLDTRNASSNSSTVDTNQDTVVTLTASPYLLHRLGSFADAQWRYRISPVLITDSDESDTLTHSISNRLTSGRTFSFLDWSFTNRAGHTIRKDDDDTVFASTSFDVAYPLFRGFDLLGGIGYAYQESSDGADDDLDGLTWDVGFLWQPSPRTLLRATYGQRDQDNVASARLSYQIGPRTSLQASYVDERTTDEQRFIAGVSSFSFNPDVTVETPDGQIFEIDTQQRIAFDRDRDAFIDIETNEPFDPNSLPTSFSDDITRTRTLRASLQHNRAHHGFVLSGEAGREDDSVEGDEDYYSGALSWSYRLSRPLRFTSRASYEHREFDRDGREDDIYLFSGALSYQILSNARASLAYTYQKHDSTDSQEEFTENTVTLGISVGF